MTGKCHIHPRLSGAKVGNGPVYRDVSAKRVGFQDIFQRFC
ncbi:hypothetical protein NY78_1004 [Desulfovibrio sp. TomC]|nr:hypothetical protein NY78_1004 [Desulfovibrio sp. TomC]